MLSPVLPLVLLAITLGHVGCADGRSARESAATRRSSGAPGEAEAGSSGGSKDADARSIFADEERLCELELQVSTRDEVEALLGPPSSEDRAASSPRLRYDEPNGSTWSFLFDDRGIWTGFTVQSAASTTVPACWAPDGGWFERPDGGWYERPDGGWSRGR